MGAIYLILTICLAVLVVLALVEAVRSKRLLGGLGQLAILAATGFAVVALTGGQWARYRLAFGPEEDGPWAMIGLIFAGVVAGMAARYFFYLKTPFTWAGLLKPLCVSPIVLLPLLGTLQDASDLEPVQIVCFALLAFQNGFFWRVVFERARGKVEAG